MQTRITPNTDTFYAVFYLIFFVSPTHMVVLNGQHLSWQNVNTVVPQGSASGPLLFLIYINYLSNEVSSNGKLFVDDISFFQWSITFR